MKEIKITGQDLPKNKFNSKKLRQELKELDSDTEILSMNLVSISVQKREFDGQVVTHVIEPSIVIRVKDSVSEAQVKRKLKDHNPQKDDNESIDEDETSISSILNRLEKLEAKNIIGTNKEK